MELHPQPVARHLRCDQYNMVQIRKLPVLTLPILIAQLRGADWLKFDMGQVYVMIAFSIFPVIIIYLILSRHIVQGVALVSVKG